MPYAGADFQWLAANVTEDAPDGTDDFEDSIPDYAIEETEGGNKIAFIGMTLEDTPELVAASGITGFTFEDEIAAGDAAVAAIQAEDPDVETIILMLHEGGIPNPFAINGCAGISGPINAIAAGMNAEIDAIVSGHTHQPYTCSINDPDTNPRPVTSAFSFGRVVTEIEIEINNTTGEMDRSTLHDAQPRGAAECTHQGPRRDRGDRQVGATRRRPGQRARRHDHRNDHARRRPHRQ